MKYLSLFVFALLFAVSGCKDEDNDAILTTDFNVTEGLIAYYPFNGNANDNSNNGNNATVYGATLITDRNSMPNSAYHFNGTNRITLSTGLDSLQKEISVSLWIKKTGNWDAGCHKILLIGNKTTGNVYIAEEPSPFNISFTLTDSTVQYMAYCVTPALNNWHHLVGVFTGVSVKFYIDNVLQTTIPCTLGSIENSPLNIGWGYDNEYFTGDIDDVRIYNRALSDEEIGQLYNSAN